MSAVQYLIGDVRERLASLPAGSVDLVVTSWPYWLQRSYLPTDHPDKHLEIGQEPTVAGYIATLLDITAELGRVLAPHGSIALELADTFSGSGGAGGDYDAGGFRDGQPHVEDARQVGAVSSSDVPDASTIEHAGWSDCGHDSWRRGVTLDPFGGSGTTGMVASGVGRDAILIDLDDRNLDLARERIGMFLEVAS